MGLCALGNSSVRIIFTIGHGQYTNDQESHSAIMDQCIFVLTPTGHDEEHVTVHYSPFRSWMVQDLKIFINSIEGLTTHVAAERIEQYLLDTWWFDTLTPSLNEGKYHDKSRQSLFELLKLCDESDGILMFK